MGIGERFAARAMLSKTQDMAAAPGVRDFLAGAAFAAVDGGEAKLHGKAASFGAGHPGGQDGLRSFLVRGPGEQAFSKIDRAGFDQFVASAELSGQAVRTVTFEGRHTDEQVGLTRTEKLRFKEAKDGLTTLDQVMFSHGGGSFSQTFDPDNCLKSGPGSLGPNGLLAVLEASKTQASPQPTSVAVGQSRDLELVGMAMGR